MTILSTAQDALTKMPTGIRRIMSNLLTGKDGVTHDPARYVLVFGSAGYLLLALFYGVYQTIHGHAVNFMDIGTGYGLVAGGGSAGVALKAKTEPEQGGNDDPPPPKNAD